MLLYTGSCRPICKVVRISFKDTKLSIVDIQECNILAVLHFLYQ